MSAQYLPFLFTHFPYFVFKRVPFNLFHFYKNSLVELNNRLQISLQIKLFFTPLFGDKQWAARVIGVLYRTCVISFGLLFLLFFTVFFLPLALLLAFGIFALAFYSFKYFILSLLVYFLLYFIFYFFNPFDIVRDDKNFYNFNHLHQISSFSARAVLKELLIDKDISNKLLKLGLFLELSPGEIDKYIPSKYDELKYCIHVIKLAKKTGYRNISPEVLLCSALLQNEEFINFIELKNLPENSLESYLITIRRDFKLNRKEMWDADYVSSFKFSYNVGKIDRISPTLNKYSKDLTYDLKPLSIMHLSSFKKYKLDLVKTMAEGGKKVLIIGDSGTGKTSIIKDFYFDIKKNRVSGNLKFNRIISLDLSSIVSLGVTGPETLSVALKEFTSLKNTILFMDNLHILYSLEGLDYMGILLPYFEDPKLKIICSADHKTYISKLKKDSVFDSEFSKILVTELEGKELFDFLVLKNWDLRKKLTIPALNFLAYASPQVLFDEHNPKKSVQIIEKSAENSKGINISKQDIAEVIKHLSGVSLGDVTKNESKNLLNLVSSIQKEVIGQEGAVEEVVNALIRNRTVSRNQTKPIASFLFAGPTGVGKTELAKSLARNFFGGEKDIIRLDMSEYQTADSVNRLIGGENGQVGLLTEAIKQTPFNLVLLDEIEKASNNIHMLFLQVLDDGRLTDNTGNTVSFKNTIIIATTNAGTEGVINDFAQGSDYDIVRKRFMQKVKGHFPPEFLNRFTEITLFKPLKKQVLEKILEIKFTNIKQQFYDSNKITVELAADAKEMLMNLGYSEEWGARSLERILEKALVTTVSKAVLLKEVNPGDTLNVTLDFLQKHGVKV